jgi:hypothetical protein
METKFEIFREMFEASQNEKRGLMVYFGGQSIAGLVVKIIGTEAVEMRSQQYSRIIVKIEAIEAIAIG